MTVVGCTSGGAAVLRGAVEALRSRGPVTKSRLLAVAGMMDEDVEEAQEELETMVDQLEGEGAFGSRLS
jgi:hypothetical protein